MLPCRSRKTFFPFCFITFYVILANKVTNEITIHISFVSTTWELLKIEKSCPKPWSIFPIIHENRFNPFDSVPLTILYVSNFQGIRKRWLSKISCRISNGMFDYRTSSSLFCRKFCNVNLFDVMNVRNAGLLIICGVKRIGSNFADKGNSWARFEAFLITSSSSHFFNKTDLEQFISLKLLNKTNILLLCQNWILTVLKCGVVENRNSTNLRSCITFHWISVQS